MKFWILVATVLLCMVVSIATADMPVAELLTASEGAMPNETVYGFAPTQILERTGPAVEMITPDMDREQKSPFNLKVKFSPKPGTLVDIATLKVEALKVVPLNITSRVRAYSSPAGIEIEQAKVPSGVHRIRFTIGDNAGGITRQVYVVRVN